MAEDREKLGKAQEAFKKYREQLLQIEIQRGKLCLVYCGPSCDCGLYDDVGNMRFDYGNI